MTTHLDKAIEMLRAHESDLHRLGAEHIAIFGSVARNEAGPDSDIDVLVDLSPALGLFGYSRLRIHIGEILQGADVVNRRALKPLLREGVLRDAVSAF